MGNRSIASLAALIAALALAGCTATPPRATDTTLYQRLGGQTAIAAVVDDTITNISADPRINARFRNSDTLRLKNGLVELLCDRTGGPCTYRGRNMADAHEGMRIRDDEFDALVEDLVKSMNKFKVPEREQRESVAILARMRNAIVGH